MPQRWQQRLKKSVSNLRLTVICGFITVIVLRGSLSIDLSAYTGQSGSTDVKVVEDIERILHEIRSDFEPEDDETYQPTNLTGADSTSKRFQAVHLNSSTSFHTNFWLRPKISNWDEQRRKWLSENPGFHSQLPNGKPRILLVTGSPPNPCDNPLGDHYLLKGMKNKIDYCRLHGIEIMHNMALLDREFSDYWAKYPLVRGLMLAHPEVEWIWWMDSDAIFTDMAFELPLARYNRHNLIIHGYPDLLFDQHSWIALNTGSFLLRNCQWSLDLLDSWAPMGPKGPIRDEAGRILTEYLKGRPDFEADDQSALIYLLLTQKEKWLDKVFVENSYYLHGFWGGLVDQYEAMMENHHPGLGDERWPFVTHFVGCKPCGGYGDYPVERCMNSMERAFNFADNQVLRLYGFAHDELLSTKIKRIREQTARPLEDKEKLDMKARITIP